jgi:eukaryotic translation initiation factor 2C
LLLFFFTGAEPPVSLGGGLAIWKGFYSSVWPTHDQLIVVSFDLLYCACMLMIILVCTAAFYILGSLAHAMIEFWQVSFGACINAFVKGIHAKTTYLGYNIVRSLSGVEPGSSAMAHI